MKNIITTPFGQIDLNPVPISFHITDSSIGARRKVNYEGIELQSETMEMANIAWKIWQFMPDGITLINEIDAVQGRTVITPISGQNRVTADGLLILRESYPEGPEGEDEFQLAKDSGYNEYHYWTALLRIAPLPIVIQAAGQMLAQLLRFDRF